MTMIVCFAVLVFCGGSLAYSSFQTNQYMDIVLHTNLPNEGLYSNIDPARLTNFSTEHKTKVMFINVNVKLDYFNGNMTGMFKTIRSGDCSPVYRDMYGNVTLNCTIAMKEIKFQFEGKMKYGKLPTVSINVKAEMSPTFLFIEVTANPNYNMSSMKKLQLTQTGKIATKYSGLGPLNSELKKLVEDAFIQRVHSEFFNIFSVNYHTALGRACTRSRFPA